MIPQFIYNVYEHYLIKNLNQDNMPHHIAIIMDGNRRYSKLQENMDVNKGHELGVDTLENVLNWSIDLGIKIITVYAFSIENFKRPENEVRGLMELFAKNFKRISHHERIHKKKVKIKVVGQIDLLPDYVKEAISEAEESTKDYNERQLNLAIGYDGRLEIVDAIKKIVTQVENGEIEKDEITTDLVSDNLYTAGLDDPNLIIRTSGEERLSGFLLWQSSYSELYFCDSLWPELRKIDFLRALRAYQERERRFGE